MNQRTERIAAEIRAILGELLARGDVKDPRVRDAGLVTITSVRVTGDLREARVAFTSFGAPPATLARIGAGLASASAHLQREIGRRLRTRVTPTLHFEVDHAIDDSFRVGELLREVATETAAATAAETADDEADDDDGRDKG